MDSKHSNSSQKANNVRPTSPTEELVPKESDGHESTYVIQRTGETYREWWTGSSWSEDVNDAKQYSSEPDVSVEADDESARPMKLGKIDD
jgi:hypothetical protein